MIKGREAAAHRFTALRLSYLSAQPLPPPWRCNSKPGGVRVRSYLWRVRRRSRNSLRHYRRAPANKHYALDIQISMNEPLASPTQG
jgi:hypothetical protein